MKTEIATIPEFTADDYYSTTMPYEWLYGFADNKFLLNQMREKLKAQAASVGVRGDRKRPAVCRKHPAS